MSGVDCKRSLLVLKTYCRSFARFTGLGLARDPVLSTTSGQSRARENYSFIVYSSRYIYIKAEITSTFRQLCSYLQVRCLCLKCFCLEVDLAPPGPGAGRDGKELNAKNPGERAAAERHHRCGWTGLDWTGPTLDTTCTCQPRLELQASDHTTIPSHASTLSRPRSLSIANQLRATWLPEFFSVE